MAALLRCNGARSMAEPTFPCEAGHDGNALPTLRALCIAALAAVQALPANAQAVGPWFLQSRHGECSPVRGLARKFADLGPVADPQAFIEFVRAKGLTVSSTALPVQAGAAVQVLVPQKELALVFVTAELCGAAASR